MLFARDRGEADHYRSLLEAVNIPTAAEGSGDDVTVALDAGRAIPLLVPECLLNEASDIIVGAQASPSADFDDDFDDDDEDDDLDDDDSDDEDEDDEEDDEEDLV